eukprot:tig00000133_g7678.t1
MAPMVMRMLACTAILLLVQTSSSVSAREGPSTSDPAATLTEVDEYVAQPRAVPAAAGPSAFATLSNVTEGRYIVRFKDDAARLAAGRRLRAAGASPSASFHEAAHVLIGRLRERLQRAARRQLLRHMESDVAVDHVYHGVFPGFVGRMSAAAAALARGDPAVETVEADGVAHLTGFTTQTSDESVLKLGADRRACTCTCAAPRGVDLLDSLVGDGKFAYEATGCGANVYLVDSGINFDLYPAQFGRRASVVFDNVHAQGDPFFKRDCNGCVASAPPLSGPPASRPSPRAGPLTLPSSSFPSPAPALRHGTHSASVVGSATYGAAKLAKRAPAPRGRPALIYS